MSHEETGPDFDAEPIRCRACLAREQSAAKFAGRDKTDPAAALYFHVHRNGGD